MGGHAVDGCGEFMPSPSSSPSLPTSLKCAACGCHPPHMLLALGSETNHYSTTPMSGKKRFRTKFTQAQKDKMHEVASKVGWKMQKRDEEMINSFCNEIGVDRNVFKVWMHNNKSTNKNNENLGHGHASSNNNNIINVNNINGHDAIDFIMSRNINNNNNGSSSSC
ncbi:ZF-HD homeobox protein [Artemisia annua]|uniref:ZF-HD homeobox protein n=1 Tax=Artemisia annua TaxID=35608 RepID=A0A2U1MCZ1_ARTAN|nr:ZF-HD homeobox protein [Artemisia annua]